MLIFGTNLEIIESTKQFLSSNFQMKDMGSADVILGIRIKRENDKLILTQSHYIEKTLKKFNQYDSTTMSTLLIHILNCILILVVLLINYYIQGWLVT